MLPRLLARRERSDSRQDVSGKEDVGAGGRAAPCARTLALVLRFLSVLFFILLNFVIVSFLFSMFSI